MCYVNRSFSVIPPDLQTAIIISGFLMVLLVLFYGNYFFFVSNPDPIPIPQFEKQISLNVNTYSDNESLRSSSYNIIGNNNNSSNNQPRSMHSMNDYDLLSNEFLINGETEIFGMLIDYDDYDYLMIMIYIYLGFDNFS
jgi:hypothetical protein